MIDWKRTAKLNNCSIKELKDRFKRFPNSNKYIIAICDNLQCKKERKIKYQDYRDLCHKCAVNTQEYSINRSKLTKKYWEDPKNHKEASERTIQYYIDHPEARENAAKITTEYFKDPKNREKAAKITTEYFKDPKNRKDQSERIIQFYIDHPEARDETSRKTIEQFEDPKMCEAARKRTIKQFEDPIAREKLSAKKQGIPYEEWDHFKWEEADWRDWYNTIYINDWFKGCHRHHITKTIVVCIPTELHNHISHNIKTGRGMAEMNILALQFMNGYYDNVFKP